MPLVLWWPHAVTAAATTVAVMVVLVCQSVAQRRMQSCGNAIINARAEPRVVASGVVTKVGPGAEPSLLNLTYNEYSA
jgi:hypothetical protein